MKKNLTNIFLLAFAAFLISTETVAINMPLSVEDLKRQEECKNFFELEKVFGPSEIFMGQAAFNENKNYCSKKKNEMKVYGSHSGFLRETSAFNRFE